MTLAFAPAGSPALALRLVEPQAVDATLAALPAPQRAWAAASGFTGGLGQLCVLPGPDGAPAGALFGWGDAAARARGRFHLARAAEALPEAVWRIEGALAADEAAEAALGWLLASYRFSRYKSGPSPRARLVAPEGIDAARIESIARAEAMTRDLINTPASDMGPQELETVAAELARAHDARVSVTRGDDLVPGFPMIHAVGRASTRAPRLIDLRWGKEGPALTLVGKGVCFDTGGLDIKPGASMLLMKKDMGGAATALAAAIMIMRAKLPVRLRMILPIVENSVSAQSFRPGDVYPSRAGLTVEIGNTDAEGRLILADALALADEDEPDLLVDFATLTGAARVALGPDLPAFFTSDEKLAGEISDAAAAAADPAWRLPLWAPYDTLLDSKTADLNNVSNGPFAGAIVAAMFLKRFVRKTGAWAHFDLYNWNGSAKPGRPEGGDIQAARLVFDLVERRVAEPQA